MLQLKMHGEAVFTGILLITLLQVSNQYSNYTCNYRPNFEGECGYSCLQQASSWHFLELMDNMPTCQYFSFYLSNGYYHSFAEKYFSKIGKLYLFFLEITNIEFSHFPNSVGSVSPFSDVIFDVGFTLQLVNVSVRREWNWKAFDELKADKGGTGVFQGYQLNLTHLDIGFSHVLNGALREIRFSGGNLRSLDDGVFTGLHKLSDVLLHDNEIQEVKRNFFASPASVLESLILKGNQIKSLPIDMFVEMPALRRVDLVGNPLLTLSEAVFRPIISRTDIIIRERFDCNCDLRWLKYATTKTKLSLDLIICDSPPELRNKSLYDVTDMELGCPTYDF